MFQWTADMIRFMRDAGDYTTFHTELTKHLLPYMEENCHICDAGCGTGYLSLALAPHVRQVTAVDLDEKALGILRDNCRVRGIENISVLQKDILLQEPDEPYDHIVFCFFGRTDEAISIAKTQCRGTVFIIKKNYSVHRFSAGGRAREYNAYQLACSYLNERGIPFDSETLGLEFGQPLRSLSDAALFYSAYTDDRDKALITDDFLADVLEKTGSAEFPWYLPHERKLGLIRVRTSDIP